MPTYTMSPSVHQGQQQHEGIPDQPDFYTKQETAPPSTKREEELPGLYLCH